MYTPATGAPRGAAAPGGHRGGTSMKPRLIVAGGGCADSAPSRKATGRSAWVISTAWGARIPFHPPGRAPSSTDFCGIARLGGVGRRSQHLGQLARTGRGELTERTVVGVDAHVLGNDARPGPVVAHLTRIGGYVDVPVPQNPVRPVADPSGGFVHSNPSSSAMGETVRQAFQITLGAGRTAFRSGAGHLSRAPTAGCADHLGARDRRAVVRPDRGVPSIAGWGALRIRRRRAAASATGGSGLAVPAPIAAGAIEPTAAAAPACPPVETPHVRTSAAQGNPPPTGS